MTFNLEKFKNILHYIIKECGDNPNVGRTVLYKLLYFSDFNFFEIYETKLTGESYKKLPHGPAPIHFPIAINELVKEEKILETTEPNYFGGLQYNYSSLKDPVMDLKEKELEVIDDVIEKLSHMNANQISDYSLVILHMSLLLPRLLLADFITTEIVAVHRSESFLLLFALFCFLNFW